MQPINQALLYPHLALFDASEPEREAFEVNRRVEEVRDIISRDNSIPLFDQRAANIQGLKIVERVTDAAAERSYGSVTRDQVLSNLDLWV